MKVVEIKKDAIWTEAEEHCIDGKLVILSNVTLRIQGKSNEEPAIVHFRGMEEVSSGSSSSSSQIVIHPGATLIVEDSVLIGDLGIGAIHELRSQLRLRLEVDPSFQLEYLKDSIGSANRAISFSEPEKGGSVSMQRTFCTGMGVCLDTSGENVQFDVLDCIFSGNLWALDVTRGGNGAVQSSAFFDNGAGIGGNQEEFFNNFFFSNNAIGAFTSTPIRGSIFSGNDAGLILDNRSKSELFLEDVVFDENIKAIQSKYSLKQVKNTTFMNNEHAIDSTAYIIGSFESVSFINTTEYNLYYTGENHDMDLRNSSIFWADVSKKIGSESDKKIFMDKNVSGRFGMVQIKNIDQQTPFDHLTNTRWEEKKKTFERVQPPVGNSKKCLQLNVAETQAPSISLPITSATGVVRNDTVKETLVPINPLSTMIKHSNINLVPFLFLVLNIFLCIMLCKVLFISYICIRRLKRYQNHKILEDVDLTSVSYSPTKLRPVCQMENGNVII